MPVGEGGIVHETASRKQQRQPAGRRAKESSAPPDAISPWVLLRSASYHPFIYKRMIRAVDPAARAGDVAQLYDKNQALFGRALYSPGSQIALRVLTHGDEPVDEGFWRGRLERAVALRKRLRLDESTDAYRLVHAEGDGLSGLIIERYADSLVFEVFAVGMYQRWRQIAEMLAELLGPATSLDRPRRADSAPDGGRRAHGTGSKLPVAPGGGENDSALAASCQWHPSRGQRHSVSGHGDSVGGRWHAVVRADEPIERIEGFRVTRDERGSIGEVTIREHGVRYRVDVAGGHKTGFFCDQRDNRLRFGRLCGGAEVLDLCCYTGGFGLCAKVLGGAREVTSVDLDEKAVAMARTNANLNQARINLVHADVFTYLRQMIANGRQYDCVVCDPSKFAGSRDEVETALRKYRDLNGLAMQVVRPGGVLLTCSCSGLVSRHMFTEAVQAGARYARRQLQVFEQSGAAADHPAMMNCPESEYLKAIWCRVM